MMPNGRRFSATRSLTPVRSDWMAGQFIATVDVSLNPVEVGLEWRRLFVVDGDRLIIGLPEQRNRFFPDRMNVCEMVWQRKHPNS
jgi:hypothetical protein